MSSPQDNQLIDWEKEFDDYFERSAHHCKDMRFHSDLLKDFIRSLLTTQAKASQEKFFKEANKRAWLETDKTVYGDDPLLEVVWAIEDLTHDEKIRQVVYDHLERVKRFRGDQDPTN